MITESHLYIYNLCFLIQPLASRLHSTLEGITKRINTSTHSIIVVIGLRGIIAAARAAVLDVGVRNILVEPGVLAALPCRHLDLGLHNGDATSRCFTCKSSSLRSNIFSDGTSNSL